MASNTTEYCKKGDVVGIKGRIQTSCNNNKHHVEFLAESNLILYYGQCVI